MTRRSYLVPFVLAQQVCSVVMSETITCNNAIQKNHSSKYTFFRAVVLQSHGLIGEGATCYPAKAFRDSMQAPSDSKVCVTDNIVTSQGPGTSLLFALTLGEQMVSKNCLLFGKINTVANVNLTE